MSFALWLAVSGILLLFMALSGTLLSRMPVSTSMLYLLAGLAAGPLGLAMAAPVLTSHAVLLEHLTEIIVLLSLFTSGMKMSLGLHDKRWFPPLRHPGAYRPRAGHRSAGGQPQRPRSVALCADR